MENFKKFLSWLADKPIATKILITIAGILVAAALVFTTSCQVAKSSINGNRVVDKHVKDSLHYNVQVEK